MSQNKAVTSLPSEDVDFLRTHFISFVSYNEVKLNQCIILSQSPVFNGE